MLWEWWSISGKTSKRLKFVGMWNLLGIDSACKHTAYLWDIPPIARFMFLPSQYSWLQMTQPFIYIDTPTLHKSDHSWRKRGLKTYKLWYSVLSVHLQGCCDDSLWRPIQWSEGPLYLFRKFCYKTENMNTCIFPMTFECFQPTASTKDSSWGSLILEL